MDPDGKQDGLDPGQLILAHRTMLEAYIFVIVRDPLLGAETFSDTVLAILKGWDRFDTSRPFAPWARAIAKFIARANLRSRSRQPCQLDDAELEAIAIETEDWGDESELQPRKEALQRCVRDLPPHHQQLIQFRYYQKRPYPEIAGLSGKTPPALYAALHRVHRALYTCIDRKLRAL